MATQTTGAETDRKTDVDADIEIATDKISRDMHDKKGNEGLRGWKAPKQSFFCCIFYSVLCIIVAIIIVITNSPTYDQEYNNPAEYYITEDTVVYVREWQFLKEFVSEMNRMVPTFALWLLNIGLPLFGSFALLGYFVCNEDSYHTSDWIWDDIISFIKGWAIVFFLSYGTASFISARISLPKPSAYDICDYSLSKQSCQKTDSHTLELAWSSFPNADISFLVSSMFYFTLYFTNKIQMILNPIFREKFKKSLEKNKEILYGIENENGNSNEKNDDNNKKENNNNSNNSDNDDNDGMPPDFGEHRMLSCYFIILIVGFLPTCVALFVSITIVHDNLAYVWDLLGSSVIGMIITWFTYRMFYDSPFDCMELGFTFELSGVPRHSFFYDKQVRRIRGSKRNMPENGVGNNQLNTPVNNELGMDESTQPLNE